MKITTKTYNDIRIFDSMYFLYRLKDHDDRDCCAYIQVPKFECGHYFGSICLQGSCYSGGDFADYDDIETVLSKSEYEELINFNKQIKELGYGITKGDDRYLQGVKLITSISYIFDKLSSAEGLEFQNNIIQDEIEWLMEEYCLNEDDIDHILDEYPCDYRDRSIISEVYDNAYELGWEEAYQCGLFDPYSSDWSSSTFNQYFDFEAFGEDLCDDEGYCLLDDGRCVRFCW